MVSSTVLSAPPVYRFFTFDVISSILTWSPISVAIARAWALALSFVVRGRLVDRLFP